MNVQMKKDVDKLVERLHKELNAPVEGMPNPNIPAAFIAGVVNAQMLVVKLHVWGTAYQDEKLDTRKTAENMGQDVTALVFNFGEGLGLPAETTAELLKVVATGMQPIIQLYYGAAINRIQVN